MQLHSANQTSSTFTFPWVIDPNRPESKSINCKYGEYNFQLRLGGNLTDMWWIRVSLVDHPGPIQVRISFTFAERPDKADVMERTFSKDKRRFMEIEMYSSHLDQIGALPLSVSISRQ
jgi:hypothetical protein